MFRSTKQQCQAIRILLRSLRLDHLWTETEPTKQAVNYLAGSPMSHGEEVLLRCAFDFWNGEGRVELGRDLLGVLDNMRLERVLTLALAVNASAEAVDKWISSNGAFSGLADDLADLDKGIWGEYKHIKERRRS